MWLARRSGRNRAGACPLTTQLQAPTHIIITSPMIAIIRLATLAAFVLLCGCGRASPAATKELNPMVVAENYARQKYGNSQTFSVPSGIERVWFVEDHGDIWIVEFAKQGAMGGGIRTTIRKADMKVVDAVLTQ